jgi:hypothetical protein
LKVEKLKTVMYDQSFDMTKLELDISCATIQIEVATDNRLRIERLHHSHIKVSEQNGTVKLRQIGKPLFHPAAVKVLVPSCCVPDISANIKLGTISVSGGIYGDVTIVGGEATINLSNLAFANGHINVKSLTLTCSDVSARQYMAINSTEGSALIDDSFCTNLDIVLKSGNIGISNLKCHSSSLSTEKGGINLILSGDESEYNLSLTSNHGLCNRENTTGAKQNIKAFTDYGNITVEFSKHKEANDDGNDDVTKDPRSTLQS